MPTCLLWLLISPAHQPEPMDPGPARAPLRRRRVARVGPMYVPFRLFYFAPRSSLYIIWLNDRASGVLPSSLPHLPHNKTSLPSPLPGNHTSENKPRSLSPSSTICFEYRPSGPPPKP